LQEHWSDGSMQWQPLELTNYIYNSSHLMTQEIYQSAATSTSGLTNSAKYNYTYDIFGNIVTGTFQTWGGNSWVNAEKITVSYNGNKLSAYTLDEWNLQSGKWEKSVKRSSTFDSKDNLTEALYQTWSAAGSIWVNDTHTLYTYDSKNNLVGWLDQSWTLPGSWVNGSRTTEHYDAWNNRIFFLDENWNENLGKWDLNLQQEDFYNCTTVGLEKFSALNRNFLFPNPAHDKLFLNYRDNVFSVRISDLSGGEVYLAPSASSIEITSLPQGMYFLQLLDKENAVLDSEKFIKD
jgi:hypothetical protein